MKKLIDYITENNLKNISIIGLAKNAGKTVTFNKIISEAAEKGISLGLLSYGRDGEETDILNRHPKPRINIPENTIFITSDQALQKSGLKAELIFDPGIRTTLGNVGIYNTGNCKGEVELVGINSSANLKKILELISGKTDLILVDGALDRRSSAIPEVSGSVILATGAVAGNTEELVIKRTINEIDKLQLPLSDAPVLLKMAISMFENNQSGIIRDDYSFAHFSGQTTFDIIDELSEIPDLSGQTIVIKGALTDNFINELCISLKIKNSKIIVKSASQVFLNLRSLNILNKANINLSVTGKIYLIAVTVNPVSPYGIKLDSGKLIDGIKQHLKGIPVYDLMSDKYLANVG